MRKCLTKFSRNVECGAVQKCIHLVDLVKSFQTRILLMFTFEVDLLKIYVVSTSKASDAESPFSGYEESMSSNRLSFIFQVVGFFFKKISVFFGFLQSSRFGSRGPMLRQTGDAGRA